MPNIEANKNSAKLAGPKIEDQVRKGHIVTICQVRTDYKNQSLWRCLATVGGSIATLFFICKKIKFVSYRKKGMGGFHSINDLSSSYRHVPMLKIEKPYPRLE